MYKFLIIFLFILSLKTSWAGSNKRDTISVRKTILTTDEYLTIYTIRQNGLIIKEKFTSLIPVIQPIQIKNEELSLVIYKKNYKMYLMLNGEKVKAYKVVFGARDIELDKFQEGDKRTPVGEFKIRDIRKSKDWNYFIELDYPNRESYIKFEERKRQGLIGATAKIGCNIGIHGIDPHSEGMIDAKANFTDGCISMKNADLLELLKYIKVGTLVKII